MRQGIKSILSSGSSCLALLSSVVLLGMPVNAHAATVQNFSITNYQSANGFCFVSFSANVTGTRNDVINGVASTNDLIRVQAHDSRGSAIQGNNTTSGNFFTSNVPNRQTNTVTGTINFAGSEVNGGPLTLIMDEGGLPFEVLGSLPLDLATMSALGGGCATAATAAGFGNQPPVISFNQSTPADGTGFTFNGNQQDIRAEARFSSDPENNQLSYSWRQIKGQNLINFQTVLNDERLQVCLLYTSPSPRDKRQSRMPSSA